MVLPMDAWGCRGKRPVIENLPGLSPSVWRETTGQICQVFGIYCLLFCIHESGGPGPCLDCIDIHCLQSRVSGGDIRSALKEVHVGCVVKMMDWGLEVCSFNQNGTPVLNNQEKLFIGSCAANIFLPIKLCFIPPPPPPPPPPPLTFGQFLKEIFVAEADGNTISWWLK